MADIFTTNGSSQDERMLPALREGYINVDEMRFEDLLAMVRQHARLLRYVDLSNRTDGHWQEFFDADEACILASIVALRLELIEHEFTRFMAQWGTAIASLRDGSAGPDILPAFRLAARIDAWHDKLSGRSSIAAMRTREKIEEVVRTSLGHELGRLHGFVRQCQAKGADAAFLSLGGIWREPRPGGMAAAPDHTAEQLLKSNFHAFYNAILHLKGIAGDLLALSLGRSNHDPAMGLLIAFLQLFGKAQGKLNGFTRKHRNFYYEDVLKTERLDFVPDSAHLIFQPDKSGREVLIERGVQFKAALDGNIELTYSAGNELLVNDAKVCALHTLYFGRNRLSFPENTLVATPAEDGQARTFATSSKLNTIMRTDGKAPPPGKGKIAFPLFGVPPRSREHHLFQEARLGFALASNVLLLKQGARTITLTFKIASGGEGEGLLDIFVGQLSDAWRQGNRPEAESNAAHAFFRAFRHMFTISLTGETGWIVVDEYLPLSHILDEAGVESDCFKIQVRLPESAGGVVPYAPVVHGERFDTDQPVMKLAINPDAYLYPYSFLRDLVISEVGIEVEATGCTDVKIYNQLGPLNAASQFNPFGPMPALGDHLVIGYAEAAQKNLTDFEVDIEWGNLPREMNGFEEYYRAYPLPFRNSSFMAALSVLRDGRWLPADDQDGQQVQLFTSPGKKAGNNRPEKTRRLSFRALCKFANPAMRVAPDKYSYDTHTKNGFFRIALSGPESAFGHKVYPMVLSQVMIENARRKKFWLFSLFTKAAPPKPLPNAPYSPVVNSVSINYRAASTLSMGRATSADPNRMQEKIFHLHPLGLEQLTPRDQARMNLVPPYDADGNLFIGIAATKLSGPLTLFFHLREDSLPEAGAMEFDFTWHYLSSNQWKKFEKSRVVSDSTDGFLVSGIVTLDVPADINRDNTILPGDLYWLRVSVNHKHMHSLCSLYGVYAQALKVTWSRQPGDGISHLAEPLPAGSIRDAKYTIPGIAAISQVMDSFGGAPIESDEQRNVRISERLKHKNRAITPWDYERLILQQFPELYRVNCMPCLADEEEQWEARLPGHLLIVVIPKLKEPASVNMQPKANALLLRRIRKFVQELAPSGVQIKVRNPDYEQIQVRCKVKFAPGKGQGVHLSELNSEIVNFMSPWSQSGNGARFGWRIRCNDVQAHLQALPYVESVSGLSMLRVRAAAEDQYRLSDTARERNEAKRAGGTPVDEVGAAHPWSIAVPFWHHLIEVVDDRGICAPEPTGVGKLAIGSTFILSGRKQ